MPKNEGATRQDAIKSSKSRRKLRISPDRSWEMNCRSGHGILVARDESSYKVFSLYNSDNEGDLRTVFLAEAEREISATTLRERTTREVDQKWI